MRFLIVLTGFLLVTTNVSDAFANPMPCPQSSMGNSGQKVTFSIFDCYDPYLSASRVWRRATSAPVDVDWIDNSEFARAPCPPENVFEIADVTFEDCSQSFDGGEYSEGESASYEGLCFSESCVPEGRWEYLVEAGGAECLSFVVHVSAASVDDCAAAGGGCTLSSRSTASPATVFFLILAAIVSLRRRAWRA